MAVQEFEEVQDGSQRTLNFRGLYGQNFGLGSAGGMVLLTALLQNLAAVLHRVASLPLMVDGLENDYSCTVSCGSHGCDFKEDNITKTSTSRRRATSRRRKYFKDNITKISSEKAGAETKAEATMESTVAWVS